MANVCNRIVNSRRDRRDFRQVAAAIIYHAAQYEIEPRTRSPFLCGSCGHVRELCTCHGQQKGR